MRFLPFNRGYASGTITPLNFVKYGPIFTYFAPLEKKIKFSTKPI